MQIIYAREPFPDEITKSIFLAGPTPRTQDVISWRPEAVKYFESIGYDGTLFIPEPRDGIWHGDYIGQVEWEDAALNLADCILFWLPRDLNTMPGFTTNDEWGRWKDSGKAVFGAPDGAPKVVYQKYYADKLGIPNSNKLEDVIDLAVKMVGDGAVRTGGEKHVPLFIWKTPQFQSWYSAQKTAGNVLEDAKLVWTFRSSSKSRRLKVWALQVQLFNPLENRRKTNETVIFRSDISSIVMYKQGNDSRLSDTQIVLVREFRVSSANSDGYIWEIPGGSSFDPDIKPLELAKAECEEETGLAIDLTRFKFHGTRQMTATLSSYKASMYSVEITDQELEFLRSQKGIPHGLTEYGEFTYVEVMKLSDIISGDKVDWSSLGMIISALK